MFHNVILITMLFYSIILIRIILTLGLRQAFPLRLLGSSGGLNIFVVEVHFPILPGCTQMSLATSSNNHGTFQDRVSPLGKDGEIPRAGVSSG